MDNLKTDLTDSLKDKKALKQDFAIIDLPDVKDIPGQEHIKVPPLGELADITISSADEEGEGLFDDDTDEDEAVVKSDALEGIEEIEGDDDELLKNDDAVLEDEDDDSELLEDDDDEIDDDETDEELLVSDDEILTDDEIDDDETEEELLAGDSEILTDDDDELLEDDDEMDDDENEEELLADDDEILADDDDELLEDADVEKEDETTSVGGSAFNIDSKVTQLEIEMLEDTADHMPTDDELSLKRAALDNTDFDNEPLNEESFSGDRSGIDLDIANTEDDDDNEAIGEEDEENNAYSIGGDENEQEEREDVI